MISITIYSKITLLVLAYLIGSIPTSVWVSRRFFGIDIREHGSGNAGATNTMRILGAKVGVPVLLFDAFKGFAAVQLSMILAGFMPGSTQLVNFQILLGISAVIGHILPVYVGFKGGKGVATMLGVIIAIAPFASLVAIGVFVVTLLITKYVSISSITAGLSFPLVMLFIERTNNMSLVLFSLAVFVMLVITHQKNIERLLKRKENRVGFLVNKKS